MAKSLAGERKMLYVAEATEMFLRQKEVDGIAQSTLVYYRGELGQFARYVGDKPVCNVSLQDGQEWVLHLAKA